MFNTINSIKKTNLKKTKLKQNEVTEANNFLKQSQNELSIDKKVNKNLKIKG